MVKEREGDLVEGRETHTLAMCCNRDCVCERKRVMARDKKGDLTEGRVCASLRCATIERIQRASTPRRK
jgi:hypothetical protein